MAEKLVRNLRTKRWRDFWKSVEGAVGEDTIDNAMHEAFERGRAQGWREACEALDEYAFDWGDRHGATNDALLIRRLSRALAARGPKP